MGVTKSEYIAKLEAEFKEMDNAFAEVVQISKDQISDPLLQVVGMLLEGIHNRFKFHEDVLINIINNSKFGS